MIKVASHTADPSHLHRKQLRRRLCPRIRAKHAPNMPLLSVMRCTTGISLTVALKPRALMMALTTSENRACRCSGPITGSGRSAWCGLSSLGERVQGP